MTFIRELKHGVLNRYYRAKKQQVTDIDGWCPNYLFNKSSNFDDDDDADLTHITDVMKGITGLGELHGMYLQWAGINKVKAYTKQLFAKKIKDDVLIKHTKKGQLYALWDDCDI